MPIYRYRSRSMDGKIHKGTMEAPDELTLVKSLKLRGLYCDTCIDRELGQPVRCQKMRMKSISPFCRQLSAMLTAGVPLAKALAVSYEAAGDKRLKDILIGLMEGVHKGRTLSEAMEEMAGVFPNLLVYMARTGESSGRLDELLMRMSDYYSREEELTGKVRTAMTYPVILLCVTLLSSAFMLTVVLPQFAAMLSEQELPWITSLMMGLSAGLRSHGLLCLLLLLLLSALFMGILRFPSARLRSDRAVLLMPIIGKLLRTVATSRFAATFSILYGSGIGILDAIHIAGRVMGNSYVETGLKQAAENLKKGKMLSQALKELDIFQPVLISMVVAGEESGALDAVLGDAGIYYEKEAERAISQMLALLEPAMILILALIVGSVVMAIMIPIFNMYSSMM